MSRHCQTSQKKSTSKPKSGYRYDPPEHMTEEEGKAWKKEQRKKRNRESAAQNRIKKKEDLKKLEKQVEHWEAACDLKTKELLEKSTLAPNKTPMPEEELAKWREEQRRKRNRETATRLRQKKRNRQQELEQDVEYWQRMHDSLSKSIDLLKKAAIASKTNDVPSHFSTSSEEHEEVAHLERGLSSHVTEFMTKNDSEDFAHQRVRTSLPRPLADEHDLKDMPIRFVSMFDEQEGNRGVSKRSMFERANSFVHRDYLKHNKIHTSSIAQPEHSVSTQTTSEGDSFHSTTSSIECLQPFTEPIRQRDANTSDRMTHNRLNQISRDKRTERQCDDDLEARIRELRNKELAKQFKFMNL